jgi:hypothetical protein
VGVDKTASDSAAPTAELDLDLTGLLGAGQVFAAAGDARRQAELIDAYCNKIGSEGCC